MLRVAVLTRPTEQRLWWAERDRGTFTGLDKDPAGTARRLTVSATSDLSQARIGLITDAGSIAAAKLAAVARIVVGEVCVIGALLEGRLDAVVDEGGHIWDQAPGALMAAEAGGLFRDPRGGARLDLRWGLYSNQELCGELFAVLAESRATC